MHSIGIQLLRVDQEEPQRELVFLPSELFWSSPICPTPAGYIVPTAELMDQGVSPFAEPFQLIGSIDSAEGESNPQLLVATRRLEVLELFLGQHQPIDLAEHDEKAARTAVGLLSTLAGAEVDVRFALLPRIGVTICEVQADFLGLLLSDFPQLDEFSDLYRVLELTMGQLLYSIITDRKLEEGVFDAKMMPLQGDNKLLPFCRLKVVGSIGEDSDDSNITVTAFNTRLKPLIATREGDILEKRLASELYEKLSADVAFYLARAHHPCLPDDTSFYVLKTSQIRSGVMTHQEFLRRTDVGMAHQMDQL